MDEIDSKALEAASAAYLNFPSHHVDGVGPVVSLNSAIEACVRAYLTASGLTSKLAALEDENKTLRELVDEASAILARLERDYCSDFTLYDGRPVSDWCAKVAALSKPAALPAAGPHRYQPSIKHMGDCSVCGHVQDHPWHNPAALPAEGKGEREAEPINVDPGWLSLADWLDPEQAIDERLLRAIHLDIELRGRKNADFAVTVHHRNIVLSAVAKAVRRTPALDRIAFLEAEVRRLSATPPAPQPLEGAVKVKGLSDDEFEMAARTLVPFAYGAFEQHGSDTTPFEPGKPNANCYNATRAILSSLSPAPQPVGEVLDGWKLVPVEPTEAMLDAYWHQCGESKEMRARTHTYGRRYYQAMLSASPSPAAQEDGE